MQENQWFSAKEKLPEHMETVDVYIENPFFGSVERTAPAVFLWFKGMDQGEFYDSKEQTHLGYVTRWRPNAERKRSVQP